MYDSKCPPLAQATTPHGYSRRAAAVEASKLATLHKQHFGIGGLPGLPRQQVQAMVHAKLAAIEATQEIEQQRITALSAEQSRSAYNLKALLLAYVNHLHALGRKSHSNAR